VREAEKVT